MIVNPHRITYRSYPCRDIYKFEGSNIKQVFSFILVLVTLHLKQYVRSFLVGNFLVYYFGGSSRNLTRSRGLLNLWRIFILFLFSFLIKLVGLILFTALAIVRLHVIISAASELYQSYLALVGNSNISEG